MPDSAVFTQIADVDVYRRRIFLRADLDCPMDRTGTIRDTSKLAALIPTLRHLLAEEALVIVAGHMNGLGQIQQSSVGAESAAPPSLEACGAKLAELTNTEVFLPERPIGDMARKLVGDLRDGRIVLLENLLSEPGEHPAADREEQDAFARRLAEGVDVYVGDCLSTEPYSSLTRLPKLCRDRACGLLLASELQALDRARTLMNDRAVVALGGSFEQQHALLEDLLRPNLTVCAGGALAATLLKARGGRLGKTEVAEASLGAARTWLDKAQRSETEVLLPTDAEATTIGAVDKRHTTSIGALATDERIADIGPNTSDRYATALKNADIGIVIGSMALTEGYLGASQRVLAGAAASRGFSVVLNEPTLPLTELLEESQRAALDHISNAPPNAFTQCLRGAQLPSVEALRDPS